MLLPSDDSLDLDASDDGALVIDRNEPVVVTLDDLKNLLPAWARGGTSDVRDSILYMWGQMARTIQARAGFVLEAQQSPRFAEGIWLDFWGLQLGKPRHSGEQDPDYRQRLLIAIDVVSPIAIKTAINNLVATFLPDSSVTVNYEEPAIDQAYLSPATSSDPAVLHAKQQTGTSPVWSAFTQPKVPIGGSPTLHQTVFADGNYRLWAYYPDVPTKKIGAFSTPLKGAQFWIIFPGEIGDDSQTPISEAAIATVNDYEDFDFTQGIDGQSTLHQTVVTGSGSPSDPYGYLAAGPDSILDKLEIELERRRAGGVSWVAFFDLPPSLQF